MEAVVTFSGCDTQQKSGQYGPYTVYSFQTQGGPKYTTFKDEVGQFGMQLIGQPVSIEYDVETKQAPDRNGVVQTYTNYKLKAIRGAAAGGAVPTGQPMATQTQPWQQPQAAPQPVVQQVAAGASPQANRAAALVAAGLAIQAGIITGITDPFQVIAVAETVFLGWIETGSSQAGAGSSPGAAPTQY